MLMLLRVEWLRFEWVKEETLVREENNRSLKQNTSARNSKCRPSRFVIKKSWNSLFFGKIVVNSGKKKGCLTGLQGLKSSASMWKYVLIGWILCLLIRIAK